MKVMITADERYPFYTVELPETLIGGEAHASPSKEPRVWKLETIEDVLMMDWLDFYDIPETKYKWIQETYKELERVKKYIQSLTKENEEEK